MSDDVRVWLVERTFSDDELNLVVLTYATPDGRREFRKERALPSFTGPSRETPVSLEVDPDDLAPVDDEATRAWYAEEAARVADHHGPEGTL